MAESEDEEDKNNKDDDYAFSPQINFPRSNLVVNKKGTDFSLKKSIGGFQGMHRFEDGVKTMNMPSQVVEQWIDAVLKEDTVKLDETKKDGSSELTNLKGIGKF